MSKTRPSMPVLPGFDSSLALLREGYLFVSNRCEALGSDVFCTRIMLHKVVCMRGPEAAIQFYVPGRFTRQKAMPRTAVALLQDRGSVQMLDGAEHQHRKRMFMEMMGPRAVEGASVIFAEEWRKAAAGWSNRRIVLYDAVRDILTRTALRWCGIPLDGANPESRSIELSSMIEGAGSIGPTHVRARLLRRRCEKWARGVICGIREKELTVEPDRPAERIALQRTPNGELLSPAVAAVELINLLRPMVAIRRFITFAAHALYVHRSAAVQLGPASADEEVLAFVQEVRRVYPFFPMIGGRVCEPFSWHGRRFAKGDWVLLDLYGTNRHPAAWENPNQFQPQRFRERKATAFDLIPQGGGHFLTGHRCPGEWLTIALTKEAVRQLLAMEYRVPEQDLTIPLSRMPAMPQSGMILEPV